MTRGLVQVEAGPGLDRRVAVRQAVLLADSWREAQFGSDTFSRESDREEEPDHVGSGGRRRCDIRPSRRRVHGASAGRPSRGRRSCRTRPYGRIAGGGSTGEPGGFRGVSAPRSGRSLRDGLLVRTYFGGDAEPELCIRRTRRTRAGALVVCFPGQVEVVSLEEARVEVDDAERGPRAVDDRDGEAVGCAGKVEVFAEAGEALQGAPEACGRDIRGRQGASGEKQQAQGWTHSSGRRRRARVPSGAHTISESHCVHRACSPTGRRQTPQSPILHQKDKTTSRSIILRSARPHTAYRLPRHVPCALARPPACCPASVARPRPRAAPLAAATRPPHVISLTLYRLHTLANSAGCTAHRLLRLGRLCPPLRAARLDAQTGRGRRRRARRHRRRVNGQPRIKPRNPHRALQGAYSSLR